MIRNIATILILACSMTAHAQNVGLNEANPSQVLDVNGKIQIGDDAAADEAGAMRYNSGNSDFEGYDGSAWQSFTSQAAGSLPTNPIPIYGDTGPVSAGGDFLFSNIKDWDGNVYNSPPTGKKIIITEIFAQGTDFSSNLLFRGYVRAALTTGPIQDTFIYLTGQSYSPAERRSSFAPLIVLNETERLRITVPGTSPQGVDFQFRGFIVDDLVY